MLHRLAVFTLPACLLLASLARPIGASPGANLGPTETGINNAPLTSSPKMLIYAGGYSSITVYLLYTHGAATQVNMSCTGGPSGQIQAQLAVANVSGSTGAIGLVPAVFQYPVAQNANLRIIIAPLEDTTIACTFSGVGATAQDTISAYARLGG